MNRNVQIVLLCEDRQHEVFARRFLEKRGWSTRRLRVENAPPGQGSAEAFVRNRFPKELAAYRARCHRVAQCLVVVVDGDSKGVDGRLVELKRACETGGLKVPQPGERVAIFVPAWNIETWLAYLEGETVDECRADYPRLRRARDCRRHADQLHRMCQQGKLRPPSPRSLNAACEEFRLRLCQ